MFKNYAFFFFFLFLFLIINNRVALQTQKIQPFGRHGDEHQTVQRGSFSYTPRNTVLDIANKSLPTQDKHVLYLKLLDVISN